MATKLLRIAAKARKERKLKFINLYNMMNEEMLLECFERLSKDKAAGIDEETKEEYGKDLEAKNQGTGLPAAQDVVPAATGKENVHTETGKQQAKAFRDTESRGQASTIGAG